MRIVHLTLREATKFLRERKQAFNPPKEAILVVGLKDDDGLHGAFVAVKEDAETAALVHVYADGSPGGFSYLYGDGWRALKAMGFTYVRL